ncbi:MAG: hypothetical protein ACRDYZ_10125 [Acidimicrobiales bacterium]
MYLAEVVRTPPSQGVDGDQQDKRLVLLVADPVAVSKARQVIGILWVPNIRSGA